jgi:hypothetical protein
VIVISITKLARMNVLKHFLRSQIGILLAIIIALAISFFPAYFTRAQNGHFFSLAHLSIAHADDGGGGSGDGGGGDGGGGDGSGGDSGAPGGDSGGGCCGGDSSGPGVGGDGGGGQIFFPPSIPVPPPVKPACTINAKPPSITINQDPTLSWSSQNAFAASIDNGIGSVPLSGSRSVFPKKTTTYTMTVMGPGGTAMCHTTVTVMQSPEPDCSIMADLNTIDLGQHAVLSWTSLNSTSASIDHGIGAVPVQGSHTVSPTVSTVYTMTVKGPLGSSWCTTHVNVMSLNADPPPQSQNTMQQPRPETVVNTPAPSSDGENHWNQPTQYPIYTANTGLQNSDGYGYGPIIYPGFTAQQSAGWAWFMQLGGM